MLTIKKTADAETSTVGYTAAFKGGGYRIMAIEIDRFLGEGGLFLFMERKYRDD